MRDFEEIRSLLCGVAIGLRTVDIDYASICDRAADAIEELLSAVPKRGEWIEDRMDYRCSVCGKTVKDEIFYMFEPYQFPPFCPNCGSRLEPPKEG